MNARRVLTAFVLALMCSGLFTWILSKRLSKPRTVVAAMPVRRIVVVSKNMQVGELLDASHLETMNWPASRALPGAFDAPQQIVGRVLLLPMSSGEPVLAHDLAPPGTGTGLMAKIPEGMRAISVRADDAADVSGFVTPGSSVDVLVTYHMDTGSGFISNTVLENVRVLAVGQNSQSDPESKPSSAGTVTLLVTPQDAVKLAQASSMGKIALILRNGADQTIPSGLAEFNFPSGDAPHQHVSVSAPVVARTAPPAPNPGFTVETIAGGKETTQTFGGNRQ